jgi:hypothetical protein
MEPKFDITFERKERGDVVGARQQRQVIFADGAVATGELGHWEATEQLAYLPNTMP